MAVKAIYTHIQDKYYRVNQETINPTNIVRMPRTHAQMSTDEDAKVVSSSIWINTLDGRDVCSNKELYDEMIQYLLDKQVKEIKTIQNHFVMFCDYTVFNERGEEVNHNTFTQKIDPVDHIYNLGVNQESELVYKQVKVFNSDIALVVKNEYPMGIMKNSCKVRYSLHINDISIYQDLNYSDSDVHKSTGKNSYPISSVLNTMVKVYSTFDNGIAIAAVEIPFIPRKIVLDLNFILDDLIVVYDNKNVMDVLRANALTEDVNGGEDSDDSNEENSGKDVQYIILNGGSSK